MHGNSALRMSPAERQRRYRDRRRSGAIRVPIDVCPEQVGALIALGLLAEEQSQDRDSVAQACSHFLRAAGHLAGLAASLAPEEAPSSVTPST